MKTKTKVGLGLTVVGVAIIATAQFTSRPFVPKAEEIMAKAIHQQLTDDIALYGGAPLFGFGVGFLISRLMDKIREKED